MAAMIDVLLATYRPDPAMLKAQIDSIRAQRGVEVNVIRREDESGSGSFRRERRSSGCGLLTAWGAVRS